MFNEREMSKAIDWLFTPKNIQGALEELYDLCDPDYMVDMLVNYSEEFDDISPALLAKSFQKNAEMISEYRVLSSAGEGIDYQGKVLLNSRAVRLLSYVEDMSGDEKVRTIQSKELWLAEDMTFYVVSCMSTNTAAWLLRWNARTIFSSTWVP